MCLQLTLDYPDEPCVPDISQCNDWGVSFSIWLKVESNQTGVLFTNLNESLPYPAGFRAIINGDQLYFDFWKNSEMYTQTAWITPGVWTSVIISQTYKFTPELAIYMNGMNLDDYGHPLNLTYRLPFNETLLNSTTQPLNRLFSVGTETSTLSY